MKQKDCAQENGKLQISNGLIQNTKMTMLMGNVHRPIVCNYNLKLFLGFFYIKFQLGGFFASSQDENKICKLVSNFYLHMYLFIARLVESECKLRIIVRIFKYTYDL